MKIISSLSDAHIDDLFALYKEEFWSDKRERGDIQTMLENSDIVAGIEDEQGTLIGFVRVLTDYVYKASIYDLIVHKDHRRRNLGTELMDFILNNPRLNRVKQIDLNCLPEMEPFYERWKFTSKLGDLKHMRRFNG